MRILRDREAVESLHPGTWLYDKEEKLWESGELRIYLRENPDQDSNVLPVITLTMELAELRELAFKKMREEMS